MSRTTPWFLHSRRFFKTSMRYNLKFDCQHLRNSPEAHNCMNKGTLTSVSSGNEPLEIQRTLFVLHFRRMPKPYLSNQKQMVGFIIQGILKIRLMMPSMHLHNICHPGIASPYSSHLKIKKQSAPLPRSNVDSSSSSCSHRPAPPPAIMGKLGRDLQIYRVYSDHSSSRN